MQREKHVRFLRRCLLDLPASAAPLDTSRLTMAYFAISGLDLLNSLDVISDQKQIVDWIYSLQVRPQKDGRVGNYGFRGSPANGTEGHYDFGHLAMTYTALASLLVLGDDLSRVDKKAIVRGMRELQLESGSFNAVYGSESDMRFVFCAAAICYILQDWTGIDVNRAVAFIANSWSYEGAFGQGPGLEAHGGSTFCAVASLLMMNQLHEVLSVAQISRLKRWCLMKQVNGFQGRPNKDADTCYSFWIGAALEMVDAYQFVDTNEILKFVLTTQDDVMGGLAKYPESFPDALHTYLGISGLSLIPGLMLNRVYPPLNITERAVQHLKKLHLSWADGEGHHP